MHRIDSVIRFITVLTFSLTPLFFLPITSDYYDFNKWALLACSAIVILLLTGLRSALTGKITIDISPLSLGLLFLTLGSLTTVLLASSDKMEGATQTFGPVTFLSLLILSGLGSSHMTAKTRALFVWLFTGSITALGVIAIYQAFGLGKVLFPMLSFLNNPLWTPAGSSVGLAGILFIALPVLAHELIRHRREKDETSFIVGSVLFVLIAIGFGMTIMQLLKQTPEIMPFSAGWAVILEQMKKVPQAVFGVGAENFLPAFTAGRPQFLNATNLWNSRFTVAPSFLFHITTTMGLLGMLGVLVFFRGMVLSIIARPYNPATSGRKLSLLAGLLCLLLLPPNLALFVVIVTTLLLSREPGEHAKTFRMSGSLEWLGILLGVLFLITGGIALWKLTNIYAAEYAYGQSVVTRSKNDGTGTYNLLISAIGANPESSLYHMRLSGISLELASAIIARTNGASGKNIPLSDKDQQLVTAFLQQAIREAKIAISKNPKSVLGWENLANIYLAFIGTAPNADQWAIAAITEAIHLDPTNPNLRVELGSVFLRTKNYDQAIAHFQSAILLKDDYANAHYNLGFAFRQKGDLGSAAVELKRTSILVKPGTIDADRVNAELSEVEKNLSTTQKQTIDTIGSQKQPDSTQILSPVSDLQLAPSPVITLPANTGPTGR